MKICNLGFIGCGNMSQAIIKSLINDKNKAKFEKQDCIFNICVSDLDTVKLDCMKKFGVSTYTDNAEMLCNCDYVLIAVKPQSAADVLTKLNFSGKIVISIMAGTTIAKLANFMPNAKIIRVMPNLNARIGKSFNAYCYNEISFDDKAIVETILSAFGTVQKVEESQMNAITGLTGSAPAFVFKFIKALVDEGINNGFNTEDARKMALATVIGSAQLVESENTKSLEDLIESVCSKGGTTIEGIKFLNEKDFENNVRGAVNKAKLRASELQN